MTANTARELYSTQLHLDVDEPGNGEENSCMLKNMTCPGQGTKAAAPPTVLDESSSTSESDAASSSGSGEGVLPT